MHFAVRIYDNDAEILAVRQKLCGNNLDVISALPKESQLIRVFLLRSWLAPA